MGFMLAEANVMRGLNHGLIDSRLDHLIEWREVVKNKSNALNVGVRWNNITEQVREDLHTVCTKITESATDCKLVVTSHFGWVYTNDTDLIDQLQQFKCLSQKSYTRAVIDRPKNTIRLKKSKHNSRSYVINTKLTTQEKENLKNFFANQQDYIKISPSFRDWLYNKPYLRTQDYFFIDYTGAQWLTMLGLIRPGIIRKTQTIITK